MNKDQLAITTCSSPHDPSIGAHVGISIRHKRSNIIVKSTTELSQFANKKVALAILEKELG